MLSVACLKILPKYNQCSRILCSGGFTSVAKRFFIPTNINRFNFKKYQKSDEQKPSSVVQNWKPTLKRFAWKLFKYSPLIVIVGACAPMIELKPNKDSIQIIIKVPKRFQQKITSHYMKILFLETLSECLIRYENQILSDEDPDYVKVKAIAEKVFDEHYFVHELEGGNWSVVVINDAKRTKPIIIPRNQIFLFTGMLKQDKSEEEMMSNIWYEMSHVRLIRRDPKKKKSIICSIFTPVITSYRSQQFGRFEHAFVVEQHFFVDAEILEYVYTIKEIKNSQDIQKA